MLSGKFNYPKSTEQILVDVNSAGKSFTPVIISSSQRIPGESIFLSGQVKFAVLIIVIVTPGVSLAPTNSTASVSYSDTKHWEEKFQILFHSQPSLSFILLAQVISG